jgi:hypothetical protein
VAFAVREALVASEALGEPLEEPVKQLLAVGEALRMGVADVVAEAEFEKLAGAERDNTAEALLEGLPDVAPLREALRLLAAEPLAEELAVAQALNTVGKTEAEAYRTDAVEERHKEAEAQGEDETVVLCEGDPDLLREGDPVA